MQLLIFQITISAKLTDNFYWHFCGGNILDSHWILTSAHCDDYTIYERYAIAGEHTLNDQEGPETYHNITQFIRHPDYNASSGEYDIALVRFDTPLVLTENIQPICLPDAGEDYLHEKGVVSGWGTEEFGRWSHPRLLKRKILSCI